MAWDQVWEEVFRRQEWGKYPNEDLIRFIARNFYKQQDRSVIKILEVGCGPGANLWYIAREGFQAYGVDGSKSAIEIARKRLNEECPHWQGKLLVGDIKKLPFEENTFDAVLDNEAVYSNSYEDAKIIYNEMLRVCKQGGKIFSRTFATGTYGESSGKSAGHNACSADVGPMAGKGFFRVTQYEEISDLLASGKITEIELLSRSVDGIEMKRFVKEWLIIAEKLQIIPGGGNL